MSSTENSNSLEDSTRSELIQKVKNLENMAKEFYKFATNNLLTDIENIDGVNEKDMKK